jgi:hypothetical protein
MMSINTAECLGAMFSAQVFTCGLFGTGLARPGAVCYSAPPASAAQEKLNEIK